MSGTDKLDRLARSLERSFLIVGALALVWCAQTVLAARVYQRAHGPMAESATPAPAAQAPRSVPPLTGAALGVLRIPRLGVSTVVAEGDDAGTLKVAIGHLPDTPMPWEEGNSALAAHRDTFFRPLRNIRVGDELQFTAVGRGSLRYRVRETIVVEPGDVWVLDATPKPMLTLITCYPFNVVGNAPHRFVVRAERLADDNSS